MQTTPASLLDRLCQPGQEEAWARFAALLTPLLRCWAGPPGYGLPPADADDLIGDVLADLVRKLPGFADTPGRSFLPWLRRVFHDKWVERRRNAVSRAAGSSGSSPPPGCGLAEEAERRILARRALELMRTEFDPATWRACWETLGEGRSAAEVAAELGMTENAVYVARCRVVRLLRREMEGLLD
jgi:RNA polymerase sigma-70 factor (ECF subfamily)